MELIITGVPVYNGTYPMDLNFTNRELHLIKRVAGVRAGELLDAFKAGDSDLFVALASIAIRRKSGVEPNEDVLWDAEFGRFEFNDDELEPELDAEGRPTQQETLLDLPGSDGGSSGSSGLTLNGTGVPLVSDPSPTGHPV